MNKTDKTKRTWKRTLQERYLTPHKNGTFRIDIQELSSVETLSNPTIYISMSNLYGTPRFVVLTLWDIRMFAFKQNYTILAKINIQKWKWFMNKHLHLYIIYLYI